MVDVTDRPKTLFIDIDGCLILHRGDLATQLSNPPELLPGVKEKFAEWDIKGYKIILTTGRKESCRKITEEQLSSLGLFWDYLIMGITSGERYVINDLKANSDKPTAIGVNLRRNVGLEGVELSAFVDAQRRSLLNVNC